MRATGGTWLFSDSKLQSTTNQRALKRMLIAAERQVAQATKIGWPALAKSWQRDVERIKERMDMERGSA
jgi:hypothetical protein